MSRLLGAPLNYASTKRARGPHHTNQRMVRQMPELSPRPHFGNNLLHHSTNDFTYPPLTAAERVIMTSLPQVRGSGKLHNFTRSQQLPRTEHHSEAITILLANRTATIHQITRCTKPSEFMHCIRYAEVLAQAGQTEAFQRVMDFGTQRYWLQTSMPFSTSIMGNMLQEWNLICSKTGRPQLPILSEKQFRKLCLTARITANCNIRDHHSNQFTHVYQVINTFITTVEFHHLILTRLGYLAADKIVMQHIWDLLWRFRCRSREVTQKFHLDCAGLSLTHRLDCIAEFAPSCAQYPTPRHIPCGTNSHRHLRGYATPQPKSQGHHQHQTRILVHPAPKSDILFQDPEFRFTHAAQHLPKPNLCAVCDQHLKPAGSTVTTPTCLSPDGRAPTTCSGRQRSHWEQY